MTDLPVYRTRGEGETSVFLLHGAYGDGRYFDDLANSLVDAGYRVIDWDCPGYGESAPASPAISKPSPRPPCAWAAPKPRRRTACWAIPWGR